jgi:hypothetical protein
MQSALEAIVGPAKGLSANVVGRLKKQVGAGSVFEQ